MSLQTEVEEINFNSNVERAVYEVFNKVCEGLGYDWRKYTSDEKYNFLLVTTVQETHIDGYPEERKDFILRREVRELGGIHCKIKIFTPKGKEFTDYDIRKMLTEWSDPIYGWPSYSNRELRKLKRIYGAQKISDEKINEVVEKILKEFEDSK